jgi:hypothetical protein
MRRGYNQDIRAEAITQRYQRKEWLDIQAYLKRKYNVVPSIRQMQKWFEDYQGTKDDPSGVKFITKAIEDAANTAKPLAQAKMMTEVMPLLTKLQKEYKMPATDAGWMAFLVFFETQIGRKDFDRIVKKYQELRDKLTL